MDARFEVIDAFVDGERVDAAALKRVLSEEPGRDYLVDAWLLREGVQEEMAHDVAPAYAAPRRAVRPWLFAAVIAGALLGGYVVGYRIGGAVMPARTAPPPATVISTPQAQPFPAPAPTRVIRMQFDAASAASGGE